MKTKGLFSKLLIIFNIIMVLSYTIATLVLASQNVLVPDSLTVSYFGFFGIEGGIMGAIKIFKMRKGE